jgi:prepilin-type N-terminal cleavage/methylation domain-containing protein
VRKLKSSGAGFSMIEVLLVVGLIGVVSAISIPIVEQTIASFRLVGSARSVTNALAVAKIRAASSFTRVRLYVDLSSKSHHVETLDRSVTPAHWTVDGGSTALPTTVTFGFDVVATPPPNSQAAIGQAPACTQDDGTVVSGTACIMFNSRGIPISALGTPVPDGVLYITDGTAVYGVTVAATGMIRLWRTFPRSTPSWVLQ